MEFHFMQQSSIHIHHGFSPFSGMSFVSNYDD